MALAITGDKHLLRLVLTVGRLDARLLAGQIHPVFRVVFKVLPIPAALGIDHQEAVIHVLVVVTGLLNAARREGTASFFYLVPDRVVLLPTIAAEVHAIETPITLPCHGELTGQVELTNSRSLKSCEEIGSARNKLMQAEGKERLTVYVFALISR
ncbi:Uncharacterised protein [Streptococcus pneumoniae]|nr:Uncharacterised protein [Streptococcus pneumoniae]